MATLSQRITELAIAIRDKVNLIMPRLLPEGGIDGQVLAKKGSEPFVTEWRNSAGGSSPNDINNVTFTWDFLSASTNADIWVGGAVSGGTISATAESMTDSKHPGVALLRSAATVGSGYRFNSGISVTGAVVLSPGMTFTSVVATNATEGVSHIGFIKTTSAARSTDGAYFCIAGDAIEAVCASNSVETVHTLPSLTNKAWYTLEIVCNEDGSITFTIYTEDGDVHGSVVITTNITTAKIGTGIVSTTTVASVISMIYIDLLRLTIRGIGRHL